MVTRRQAVLGGALLLGGVVAAPAGARQDPLAELANEALRQQVRWFIDLLNSGGAGVSEEEIAAHFTPDFLNEVPASEVLGTVGQLRELLGTVTVERVAGRSTETDAGVVLVGESGVRVRVTLWIEPMSGLIGGLLIEPDATTPAATAAVASPAAAIEVAPAMDDVLPAWQVARDDLLALGREVMPLVLAGDDAALMDHLTPALATALDATPLSTILDELQANRVHFEWTAVGAVFDGHMGGDRIAGFFHLQGPGTFELAADEPGGGDAPGGRWSGVIGGGANALRIAVTFHGDADALSATLDIPDQGVADEPLDNVAFRPEQPLGDRVHEHALPLGGPTGNNVYVVAHAWGDGTLALTAGFDAEGRLGALRATGMWPLPPDPAEDLDPPTLRLPFAGAWLVFWGGDTELENSHVATPVQRHACDLVVWRDGATYRGEGTANADYYAWGQPVLAPADGDVVSALNDEADLAPNQITDPEQASVIDPTTHPAGNHVVLQLADAVYVLIAHMQRGSVQVRPGDTVRAGDLLGLAGNSGNSSEPHIHIHAQDGLDLLSPETGGLPLRFAGYIANGEPVDIGSPVQGDLIAPAGDPT